ncbi:MAG: helix-turn-helix domain-containing protein, partial [Pseudomonadota bacterium]
SRKGTAEQLGISQRTLRYKLARMREAGIRVPEASGFETV